VPSHSRARRQKSIDFIRANQDRTITVGDATLPGVPRYAVQLRFSSDDDRAVLVPRLRELEGVGEVAENEIGARIVFDDIESPVAALVRSQMLVHAACCGTPVAPADVRRSPSS
jgi:hypothetical protein